MQQKQIGKVDLKVLEVPQGGHSSTVRQSFMEQGGPRPVPGGGRPRPKPRAVKNVVRVKALYDYDAQENDEISIKAGDTFELVREGKARVNLSCQSSQDEYFADDVTGWWTGKVNGQEGFFPGNYVEKI